MLSQLKTALSIIESQHQEILTLVESVGIEGMNWVPAYKDVNSIYALATHTILSQLWWIKENLHGQMIERDRPAEFTANAQDLVSLKRTYKDVQKLTEEILESLKEDDLQIIREVRDKKVTIEWIVLHVIDHTGLHLGHLQLTKQLWEGQKQ